MKSKTREESKPSKRVRYVSVQRICGQQTLCYQMCIKLSLAGKKLLKHFTDRICTGDL